MNKIKDILHEKRKTTEDHIRQLQQVGKQGIRYTAMMPDIPFLVLGLLSDIGWIMHLTAGIIYFSTGHAESISTVDAMFESVSAFATVGLSVGVSAAANHISRIALILTMFLGRVGPVSLALSLAMRPGKKKNQVMPEAKILVG